MRWVAKGYTQAYGIDYLKVEGYFGFFLEIIFNLMYVAFNFWPLVMHFSYSVNVKFGASGLLILDVLPFVHEFKYLPLALSTITVLLTFYFRLLLSYYKMWLLENIMLLIR